MPKHLLLLVLVLPLLWRPDVHAARILGVLSLWAKSHHVFTQSVMRVLAEAGHEVVVYSPFPPVNPHPNYTHVTLENIGTDIEPFTEFLVRLGTLPHWKCSELSWEYVELYYSEFIGDKKIKLLLQSKEKFDLVIVEENAGQEFCFIFGHIFKAPTITLTPYITFGTTNSIYGNSLSLSHLPDGCMPLSNKMSLRERVLNSFSVLRTLYYFYTYFIPKVDALMRKDIPDMPPLTEIIHNVSLGFTNAHQIADYPHPLTPNMVPVGGVHITEPRHLPQEIQTFMDEATHGVIFFSLGTYVPDHLLPSDYFQMHINVFKQLPQRILWKTKKDNIEGLPDNVMAEQWFPQSDILAHPKCVLFITHGGLHSRHETIHYGVPVVGIPQFCDQPRNIEYFVNQEVGVKIYRRDLSEKTLLQAILTVTTNPKYKENMRRLSALSRDRPLTPAQSVVYWTEHVLRHGGAPHLRPASTSLSWYQLALLDVLAVCLAVALVAVMSVGFLVITLYKWTHSTNRDKLKQS